MLRSRCLWHLPWLRRRSCVSADSSAGSLLATFDFDKTIIDVDSYSDLGRLLAPEERAPVLALIDECGWMVYIRRALELLPLAQVGPHVRRLPAVPGMLRLLRRLERRPLDMRILSDANSYFISEWLAAHGLCDMFTAIDTNPAHVQPDGRLLVEPFEQQTHCDQCPDNLCKGSVIRRLLPNYSRIIYVGDSCNDLCAVRNLRSDDVACVRRGEELHGKLAAHRHEFSCQVLQWRDGHELEQLLFATGGSLLLL